MWAKSKVLLVEDDNAVAKVVSLCLGQDNFEVSVLQRGDGVVTEVRQNPPDVILLDLILPGKDGISICREIRTFSTVPILMLTGKVEEDDRLTGLEAGADDYICKPFSPRELAARIKAVLRRKNPRVTEEILAAGPVTVRPESHTATVGNTFLKLTPNEFELLKILIAQPGNVFERDDLIAKICKSSPGPDRVIDAHIKNLRKKIAEIIPGHNFIRTVYGMGYSFSSPDSGCIMENESLDSVQL
jgi:two-component system, OmpR family, response regulator BaeR